MYGGYLVIETDNTAPGMVRIRETASLPPVSRPRHGDGPTLWYAARFDDLSAGHMHAHAALRRRLVDVDEGLYRSDPMTAVAAVDAGELNHRRVYLSPELARDPALAAAIDERRSRHRLADRIWRTVGLMAALFLLTKLLLGF